MIERWTPKLKKEQCMDGLTLRMWTDKDGDYVLYKDYLKLELRIKELEHNLTENGIDFTVKEAELWRVKEDSDETIPTKQEEKDN